MTISMRALRAAALTAGLTGLLASALTAGAAATAAEGAAATSTTASGTYLVTLEAPPTAMLGVRGQRFDRTRSDVEAEAARLLEAQDALLDEVGEPRVLYRFTTALNGFAAYLTHAQVKELRAHEDVSLVERSTRQSVATVDSPDFLRARQAWKAVGGAGDAGRGTVVGVIDSGIWPENPSFAGVPMTGGDTSLPGFHGTCDTGDQWDASTCTSKVVAARYFVEGFGREDIAAADYLSPRDGSGHGSHTAAVAAGNDDVRVDVDGQDFGTASGMAPAARIAAYKACWSAPDPDDDGCTTADAVAAIDQAVADGVDVISYAVSGTGTGAVELAFLNAAAAGVFVATSAGNDGPAAGSIEHSSPWVTTVAASTHKLLQGALVLGDGTRAVGAMVSDRRVGETGIVMAEGAAAPGVPDREARLCQMGTLDAERVQGKIVVCERGTTPRVEKSAEVLRAGGAAMVLVNVAPDSTDADIHAVPSVHLDQADATVVREYVEGNTRPTAWLDPRGSDDTPAPVVADFSSRGPAAAADGDLLKPDLTAPGANVVAATAPPASYGRLWDLSSGTSLSAAHVAGLAALVLGERPGWSPSMIKSAMSTTAAPLSGTADPLAQGAGQVQATAMLDPGLALEESARSYRLVAQGRLDASRLNLPSIAIGDLTGSRRIVRTVTNVSGAPETYTARVSGLRGVDVTVRPQRFTVRPGRSARIALTFRTRPDAQLESTARGRLTLTGGRHEARLPVVVRPRTLLAPPEVIGSGASGSVTVAGTSGTTRPVPLTVSGLVGASPVGLTLEPGRFDERAPRDDDDTAEFPVEVPAGSDVVRVELEGRGTDDLDLYLYRDDELVAQATGTDAVERLTLLDPEPGDHTLYVHSAAAGNGSTTTAQLYTWVLGDEPARNLQAPRRLATAPGRRFEYDLTWSGLDETRRWFGVVRYEGTDQRSFVRVN